MLNDFGITKDGGATWQTQALTFSDLKRVFFLTDSIGFITSGQGLIKTTNGGATWKKISNQMCAGVYFADSLRGWIGMQGALMQTTDGGNSFMQVAPALSDAPYIITLVDSLHGWAVAPGGARSAVYRTVDGGATWTTNWMNTTTHDGHFINANTGYIVTGDGVSLSTDGGATWTRILQTEKKPDLIEVFFLNEHTGWASDLDGNTYRWN